MAEVDHKLRPGVPSALEQVCLRALAKEPEGRFSSAADMSAALQEHLDPGEADPAPLMKLAAGVLVFLGISYVLLGLGVGALYTALPFLDGGMAVGGR